MKTTFKILYKKDAILDTNVVSDLKELGILSLVKLIFNNVYISKNCEIEELDEETALLVQAEGFIEAHLERNDSYEKFIELKKKYPKLSTSDVIVICIANEKGIICCTNDKRARKASEDLNIEVAGTIGIMACAYENAGFVPLESYRLLRDDGNKELNNYDAEENIHNNESFTALFKDPTPVSEV